MLSRVYQGIWGFFLEVCLNGGFSALVVGFKLLVETNCAASKTRFRKAFWILKNWLE